MSTSSPSSLGHLKITRILLMFMLMASLCLFVLLFGGAVYYYYKRRRDQNVSDEVDEVDGSEHTICAICRNDIACHSSIFTCDACGQRDTHLTCVRQWFTHSRRPSCVFCRAPLYLRDGEIHAETGDDNNLLVYFT